MTSIRLFGTETSPYVRRVRIVAHELGVDVELVNTADEAGQARLREVSPIWKVPAAVFVDGGDEQLVLDSTVICAHMMALAGPGPLAPLDPSDLDSRNLQTVVDGALDSLVNVFYLGKDGVTPEQASYVAKQRARTESACRWLEDRVQGDSLSGEACPHLVDIALATTIAWMQFRTTYPVDRHPGLMRCFAALDERASFQQTRPPEG
jgi:glutathione S-transferase